MIAASVRQKGKRVLKALKSVESVEGKPLHNRFPRRIVGLLDFGG
jgi:hypothetical protein